MVGAFVLLLIAAAPDPDIGHMPPFTVNAKTNIWSDNGTAPTFNGSVIGGGGTVGTSWINVTNYGVKGDAIQTTGSGTNGNSWINLASTNALTLADIGKFVTLQSGGQTNDSLGYITGVTNGTNIAISAALNFSITNGFCTIGTSNTIPFQAAMDAAAGGTLYVPPGNYLIIPRQASHVGSLYLTNSSVRIVGDSPLTTRILGNGAWRLDSGAVHRGYIFASSGLTATNASFVVENITMDGGVQVGYGSNHAFPASTDGGTGWDVTHGAYQVVSGVPTYSVSLINCVFQHWRGEILKGNSPGYDTLCSIQGCMFWDGNATGYNMPANHTIQNCRFDTVYLVAEYFQGYGSGQSSFTFNYITNSFGGITIGGSSTNNLTCSYEVLGNHFQGPGSTAYAIFMSPAVRVRIIGNHFSYYNAAVSASISGYQGDGSDWLDILVSGNEFDHVTYCNQISGSSSHYIRGYQITGNIGRAPNAGSVYLIDGNNVGYFTNVTLSANTLIGASALTHNMGNGVWQDVGGNYVDSDQVLRPSEIIAAPELIATNAITLAGSRITSWPAAPTGTMVESGITATGNVPATSDTKGTNFTASPISVSGTNATVTGGIAVYSGTFTNSLTLNGNTITSWPSGGGGTVGTMVAGGSWTTGALPMTSDTTGTNMVASPFSGSGTNGLLTGTLKADSINATNQIYGSAAGTAIAPSFAFIGDTNTGFYRASASTVVFTAGGADRIRYAAGTPILRNDGLLEWSNGTSLPGSPDLSLQRAAAGVLRVGNAGSAMGSLVTSRLITTKTSNYSLLVTDSFAILSNSGAAGEVDFTLPTWAAGLMYTFDVEAAQTLKVIAPGTDTIRIAGSVSAAGGNVTNGTIGGTLTIVATISGKWVALNHEGTWTVN